MNEEEKKELNQEDIDNNIVLKAIRILYIILPMLAISMMALSVLLYSLSQVTNGNKDLITMLPSLLIAIISIIFAILWPFIYNHHNYHKKINNTTENNLEINNQDKKNNNTRKASIIIGILLVIYVLLIGYSKIAPLLNK